MTGEPTGAAREDVPWMPLVEPEPMSYQTGAVINPYLIEICVFGSPMRWNLSVMSDTSSACRSAMLSKKWWMASGIPSFLTLASAKGTSERQLAIHPLLPRMQKPPENGDGQA